MVQRFALHIFIQKCCWKYLCYLLSFLIEIWHGWPLRAVCFLRMHWLNQGEITYIVNTIWGRFLKVHKYGKAVTKVASVKTVKERTICVSSFGWLIPPVLFPGLYYLRAKHKNKVTISCRLSWQLSGTSFYLFGLLSYLLI